MATSNPTITFDQTSDATFRAWGSAISTALQAVGLVLTTDTGQINWTTATKAAVSATSVGYEIYRLNDGLQATKPVFMKIEYGSGNSGTSQIGIWITFSTSTNGAGTLNGVLLGARKYHYGPGSTTPQSCNFASDGSYLVMMLTPVGWTNTAGTFFTFLAFDRTRDAANAITSDGFQFMSTQPAGGTALAQFNAIQISANALNPQSFTRWSWTIFSFRMNMAQSVGDTTGVGSVYTGSSFFQIPLSTGTATYAGDAYYFPQVITSPTLSYGSLLLAGYATDLPTQGTTITVPVLGGTHTYMAINLDMTSLGTGTIRTLVRYE